MNTKTMKWVNTVAFALMVIINALANLIPIGIGPTGAISQKYENLFTPAPITFYVWGVIYLFMAIFVIYQWGFSKHPEHSDRIRGRVGLWFVISCATNIGWIFAWHYDVIWLSVVMIVGLLASLSVITKRLKTETSSSVNGFVSAGFDIYFGWILAATIANISVLFTKMNWLGLGTVGQFWTIIVLLFGALIGGAAAFMDRKWLAAVAMIWAYTGILIRHISPVYYAAKYPWVIAAAIAGIVMLLCAMAMNCCRKYCKMRNPYESINE